MATTKAKVQTQRKRKPRMLAVIDDNCTGCAGSPVCVELCPVADCMLLVEDPDHGPWEFIWVDPLKCIGCNKCISGGTKEHKQIYLEGCPWDAIEMVKTAEWEDENGELPF